MILRRTGLAGSVLAGLLSVAAIVAAPAGATAAPASDTGGSVFVEPGVTTTAPAGKSSGADFSAADFDGRCELETSGFGDFCVYSGSGRSGSVADFTTDRPNLFLTQFPTVGLSVGGNAVSAANEDSFRYVIVWTNPNYTGAAGPINPGQFGDFCLPWFKNLGSFQFV